MARQQLKMPGHMALRAGESSTTNKRAMVFSQRPSATSARESKKRLFAMMVLKHGASWEFLGRLRAARSFRWRESPLKSFRVCAGRWRRGAIAPLFLRASAHKTNCVKLFNDYPAMLLSGAFILTQAAEKFSPAGSIYTRAAPWVYTTSSVNY